MPTKTSHLPASRVKSLLGTHRAASIDALDAVEADVIAERQDEAKPVWRRFRLVPWH
jgi:hypothetical protein